jgi:hypothetical protein
MIPPTIAPMWLDEGTLTVVPGDVCEGIDGLEDVEILDVTVTTTSGILEPPFGSTTSSSKRSMVICELFPGNRKFGWF